MGDVPATAREGVTRSFSARAEAVAAVVRRADSLAAALALAVDLTKEQGGRSLVAPALSATALGQLAELCLKADLLLITSGMREHGRGVATAVTFAHWGVAETGTVIIDSRSEEMRLATMLCEVHVVLLPEDMITADLESISEELQELMGEAPGYMAFITGASRTADIERVLTIGVHGPKELHIFILPGQDR